MIATLRGDSRQLSGAREYANKVAAVLIVVVGCRAALLRLRLRQPTAATDHVLGKQQ